MSGIISTRQLQKRVITTSFVISLKSESQMVPERGQLDKDEAVDFYRGCFVTSVEESRMLNRF